MSAFLFASSNSSDISHRRHAFFPRTRPLVRKTNVSFATRHFPTAVQPGETPTENENKPLQSQLLRSDSRHNKSLLVPRSSSIWLIVLETSLQVAVIALAVMVSIQARKKALSLALGFLSIPALITSAARIFRARASVLEPALDVEVTDEGKEHEVAPSSSGDAELVKSTVEVDVKEHQLSVPQNELLATSMKSALSEEMNSLRYFIEQFQKATIQREQARNASIADAIVALNGDIRSLRRSIDTRNQVDATAPFSIVSELELVKSRLKETETFKGDLEMQLKATEVNFDEAKRAREQARRQAEEAANREFTLRAELATVSSRLQRLDDVTERLERAEQRNDELREQILSRTAEQESLRQSAEDAERRVLRVENISQVLRNKMQEITGRGAELFKDAKEDRREMSPEEQESEYWMKKLRSRGNLGPDSIVFDDLINGKKRAPKIWPSDPLGAQQRRKEPSPRVESMPPDGGFGGEQSPSLAPGSSTPGEDKMLPSVPANEKIFSFSRGEFNRSADSDIDPLSILPDEGTSQTVPQTEDNKSLGEMHEVGEQVGRQESTSTVSSAGVGEGFGNEDALGESQDLFEKRHIETSPHSESSKETINGNVMNASQSPGKSETAGHSGADKVEHLERLNSHAAITAVASESSSEEHFGIQHNSQQINGSKSTLHSGQASVAVEPTVTNTAEDHNDTPVPSSSSSYTAVSNEPAEVAVHAENKIASIDTQTKNKVAASETIEEGTKEIDEHTSLKDGLSSHTAVSAADTVHRRDLHHAPADVHQIRSTGSKSYLESLGRNPADAEHIISEETAVRDVMTPHNTHIVEEVIQEDTISPQTAPTKGHEVEQVIVIETARPEKNILEENVLRHDTHVVEEVIQADTVSPQATPTKESDKEEEVVLIETGISKKGDKPDIDPIVEEVKYESFQELMQSASELVKKARTRGLAVKQADHLFSKALLKLKEALKREEDIALVQGECGGCLLAWAKANIGDSHATARLTQSLEYLSASLALRPEDETTLFNTGLCLCLLASAFDQRKAQEYYRKACEMYDRLLEINSESRIGCFNCGLAYVSLGRISVAEGKYCEESAQYFERAMTLFEKALELKPFDGKAMSYIDDCKRQIAQLEVS